MQLHIKKRRRARRMRNVCAVSSTKEGTMSLEWLLSKIVPVNWKTLCHLSLQLSKRFPVPLSVNSNRTSFISRNPYRLQNQFKILQMDRPAIQLPWRFKNALLFFQFFLFFYFCAFCILRFLRF